MTTKLLSDEPFCPDCGHVEKAASLCGHLIRYVKTYDGYVEHDTCMCRGAWHQIGYERPNIPTSGEAI